MIEVSVPGKLYIAGEYAVVEPGYPAVVVAVDQFISVTIKKATKNGSIQSQQYSDLPIRWTRNKGELILDHRDNPFHYILAAIRLTEKYAQEKGIDLGFYDLKVTSELDSSSGRKYGLGSSGAVTVATIKALNLFYNLKLDQLTQFKIAALAHLDIQSNGSCGDIAASCFGGWIAFSTFDHEWVKQRRKTESLVSLIEMNWPKLSIRPLTVPKNLRLLIGWTGSPASTSDLVDQVNESKEDKKENQVSYQKFLQESKSCVEELIDGFLTNDVSKIKEMIRKNRQLLHHLSKITHVQIETPALKQLCDLAEACGGAAKSSGAGGGDCGIVIADQKTGILPLMSRWEEKEIIPLPLHVYHYRGGKG
ncbi:MAG TPA: phosphomevalonate kinase [Candidatus Tetragenococcus pullicola]|nr:phosphomevalonate kinase [Candidatus Tetragenococcus pullicola]